MSRRAARTAFAAAVLLLPLAGCGSGAPRAQEAAANSSGDYVARMQALNEKERNVVLFRAIRDAGRACQRVERSTTSDPVGGKPAWIATCDDRSAWLVTLGNDGVATVTAVGGQRSG